MGYHFGNPRGEETFAGFIERIPQQEFSRATRSTIPLLAWWGRPESRLELADRLGVGDLAAADSFFEYPVASAGSCCGARRGRGKHSFTDLMLKARDTVLAIEAKYTEKRYPTVREWLADEGAPEGASDNKKRVLAHWLHAAGSTRPASEVRDLTYQMIHRTASACVARQEARASVAHVVHLLFSSKHVESYAKAVRQVRDTLNLGEAVRFSVLVAAAERAVTPLPRGEDLRRSLVQKQPVYEFKKLECVKV